MSSFKLEPDHVSLNAPNILFKRYMTYTNVIPWDWSAHRILSDAVPIGVRHLMFNCHGHAWRKQFKTPHLAIGTAVHPGNVDAFDALAHNETLCVIWLSGACGVTSSSDGVEFCKAMARRSRCYVISQAFAAPDVALPAGHADDNRDSQPYYVDPDGDPVSRADFIALGEVLGFTHV